MKLMFTIIIASIFMAVSAVRADEVKHTMNFEGVSVMEVLSVYQKLSGNDLLIDSHVRQLNSKIAVATTAALTKEESLKLIEKTLLKQAGVVVTRLDDKQVSVTYNDALPITK